MIYDTKKSASQPVQFGCIIEDLFSASLINLGRFSQKITAS